jgi:beta-lactam-binding protein with PASTA domain
MTQVIAAVVVALLVAVVSLIVWLSTARKKQVQAEAVSEALKGAKEVQSVGNKVMAEPVADELAWLVAARQRLRDRRDLS